MPAVVRGSSEPALSGTKGCTSASLNSDMEEWTVEDVFGFVQDKVRLPGVAAKFLEQNVSGLDIAPHFDGGSGTFDAVPYLRNWKLK